MEFVALGIWFIFHPGFLSYLKDFPRFWLQLDRGKLAGEEGNLVGLSGGGGGGGGRGGGEAGGEKGDRELESVTHNSAQLEGWEGRRQTRRERS